MTRPPTVRTAPHHHLAAPHHHLVHAGRLPPTQPAFIPSRAATALARKLSLQQAVAQLFVVSFDGRTPAAAATLGGIPWGGVVFDSSNFQTDIQVGTLAAAAASAIRTPAPLLAATQEGGPDTAFPNLPPRSEAAIGAGGTPALATSQAQLAAVHLRALGFNMNLAPLADVDTPGGPLTGRLFSTDPATVARFSAAAVQGYLAAGVIPAVGHFPGSGGASADPDQMTATVGGSLAQLEARDLVPFAAVAPTAPVIVMSNAAYTAFDGVTPAGLEPRAVALLRSRYHFAGVAMSDDLDAGLQPTGEDPGTVAMQALRAGDDLLYITGPPSEHLAAYGAVLVAAQNSPGVRSLVQQALLRILTLKADFGLIH